MGCFGEDDSIYSLPESLTNLAAETLDSAAAAATVLSPMNSNFLALGTKDLLRSILELLPPADLARAACVCRLWREVASGREMQERAFRKPFMVRRVLGSPSSSGFWRHPDLDRFAISHRLVRGDTVPGLALKYSVQLMDIKRLNNMMSDHGIYSRQRLLIPIRDPNLLHNSTCYIELDPHAKREVAVLYLEGRPDGLFLLPRGRFTTEQGRKKILDSVKRSLQVDDETAAYYLSVSNGDPREAILQFSEDLSWEREQLRRAHW